MKESFKTHSAQTAVTSPSAFSLHIKGVWANERSAHSAGWREDLGVAAAPLTMTPPIQTVAFSGASTKAPESNIHHSPLIKAHMEKNNELPTPVPSQHFPQKVWHLLNSPLSQGIPGS